MSPSKVAENDSIVVHAVAASLPALVHTGAGGALELLSKATLPWAGNSAWAEFRPDCSGTVTSADLKKGS